MRKTILISACFILLFSASLFSEQLSPEEDAALYNQIMIWRGQSGVSQGLGHQIETVKCGTPAVLWVNDRIKYASPTTQQAWAMFLYDRYDEEAPETYGSPGGHFLIHYATSGVHAALTNADFGIDPDNGVPEYVESTAVIFDHVWDHEVNTLGYKEPPSDDFYEQGGDARVDIYLVDLETVGWHDAYGVTFPDYQFGTSGQYSTAFQALDNDYQELELYADRPLDAMKVTAAHEFFHVVQFGYDATEFEENFERHHWIEMSAVFMEDEVYDDINDYYYYLPTFFANIGKALHASVPGLYQYGAVLWPKFLADKWGKDIIKNIWERCETFPGPNVFQTAFPEAIEEYSGGEYDFGKALAEFHVWDYFTGLRARPDFGFEEAPYFRDYLGNLIQVPDSVREGSSYFHNILSYDSYPFEFNVPSAQFKYFPYQLGTMYMRFSGFEQLDSTLTIKVKGARQFLLNSTFWPVTWYVSIVAYNPHVPSDPLYIDPETYVGDSAVIKLDHNLLLHYDEVIMTLSPFADLPPNFASLGPLPFRVNVADTSEPIQFTVISDPYPNPYVIQSADQDLFVEVTQPEPQPISLQVFTIAGEKVIEKSVETNRTVELITWDGKNENGEIVASGMYLVYISAGDVNRVCKVAIIE